MDPNKVSMGWLSIKGKGVRVELKGVSAEEFFDETDLKTTGGDKARAFITEYLDHDLWTLEQLGFLGYRILEPKDVDILKARPWEFNKEWTDEKANLVCRELHRLRPEWGCTPENFNGLIMADINLGDVELHFVFGNANTNLGGDLYLSIGDMEEGVIQDETIDTGVDASKEPAQVIAGAMVGAVETFITYMVPVLRDRKDKPNV